MEHNEQSQQQHRNSVHLFDFLFEWDDMWHLYERFLRFKHRPQSEPCGGISALNAHATAVMIITLTQRENKEQRGTARWYTMRKGKNIWLHHKTRWLILHSLLVIKRSVHVDMSGNAQHSTAERKKIITGENVITGVNVCTMERENIDIFFFKVLLLKSTEAMLP